ncbi:MAG: gliding motility-associated C-terminal domain-containing protein [Bacteroidia bacterium]|nr:gliding motility-associated C-terminal domain-containing protein [Bacteroidia bacterium]
MKKQLLIALALCTTQISFGQIKPIATYIAEHYNKNTSVIKLFTTVNDSVLNAKYKQQVTNYVLVTIDELALNILIGSKPQSASIEIPMPDNTVQNVNIVSNGFNNNEFEITLSNNDKTQRPTGINYRGVLQNDTKSLVAISFFENDIIGIISNKKYGDINIGKIKGEKNLYIIYCAKDFVDKPEFKCGGDLTPPNTTLLNNKRIKQIANSGNIGTLAIPKCVRIYLETDYAFYQAEGNSTANVTNWLQGMFNLLAIVYQNESIKIEISQLYIWNTQDNYSTTNVFDPLNEFTVLRQGFNGDLAHLISFSPSTTVASGGVAWLDVLCKNYAYATSTPPILPLNHTLNFAYSNVNWQGNLPTFNSHLKLISHEMGHNMGSNHTHWCGWSGGPIDGCYTVEGTCAQTSPAPNGQGTIMSYCSDVAIQTINGFGPLPGALIRDRYNNATCLQACSCTNYTLSSTTTNAKCYGISNGGITLNVTGGIQPFSYTWSNGATTQNLTNVNSGIYSLEIKDSTDCYKLLIDTIKVNTALNGSLQVTAPLCNGNANGSIKTTMLPPKPNYTYGWSTAATTQNLNNIGAATYYITVTDTSGCKWRDSAIMVAPLPLTGLIMPLNQVKCIGDSIRLLAETNGGVYPHSHEWNVYNRTTLLTSTDTAINNLQLTSTFTNNKQTYVLITVDSNNCTRTDTFVQWVNSNPPSYSKVDDTICSGKSIIISPTSSSVYDVYGSSTSSTSIGTLPLSVSPTITTLYYVQSVDTNGCKSPKVPYAVVVNTTPPVPTISTVKDSFCLNENATINIAPINYNTYFIYDNGVLIYTGSSPNYAISNLSLGQHTITSKIQQGNCICDTFSNSHTINVVQGPALNITDATAICKGDSLKLVASPNNLGGYTFFINNTMIQNGALNSFNSINFNNNDTVHVMYSGIGCKGPKSDSVIVKVNPLPTLTINDVAVVCTADSIALQAVCSTCIGYNWFPANYLTSVMVANPKAFVDSTIIYYAQGTDTNNCKTIKSVEILFSNNPIKTINDTTLLISHSINLTTNGTHYSYSWTPTDSLNCTNCANPKATPYKDIEYVISATDYNGCVTKDSVKIKIKIPNDIFIPDVFSPNGDGENDVLYVRGESIIDLLFVVYDRWGNIVFQTTNKNKGWNGLYNGSNAEEGVYVYFANAKLITGKEVNKKGDITLIK